jgi:hypothetical protein
MHAALPAQETKIADVARAAPWSRPEEIGVTLPYLPVSPPSQPRMGPRQSLAFPSGRAA